MPGYELIGQEELDAIADIFKKGGVLYRYGLDERRQRIFRVEQFEKSIAEKVGARYALCVCNGTAALKLALVGLGVKAGDEVITQSFTFIATVEAILELGAKPVIVEVDASLNMDPVDLKKKITQKTKAILPVHMAGAAARMDEILAVARAANLPVCEDSAQALGGSYKGKHLGTLGQAGIYSLDVGKIITTGEGGVVVTNDPSIYARVREYSDHGHEQNPQFSRGEDTRTNWGFNYKATELHGAIGMAQLKKLDLILEKQRVNKKRLKDGLRDLPEIEFRDLPDPMGDAGDTLIFFLENQTRASKIAKKMTANGVGTKNLPDAINWHYAGTWTHIFNAFPEFKNQNLEQVWKQSTNYLRRAIALPVMVQMMEERLEHVIGTVRKALSE